MTDRLLTESESLRVLNKYPTHSQQIITINDYQLRGFTRLLVAQDAKTARLVAEEIFGEIEEALHWPLSELGVAGERIQIIKEKYLKDKK